MKSEWNHSTTEAKNIPHVKNDKFSYLLGRLNVSRDHLKIHLKQNFEHFNYFYKIKNKHRKEKNNSREELFNLCLSHYKTPNVMIELSWGVKLKLTRNNCRQSEVILAIACFVWKRVEMNGPNLPHYSGNCFKIQSINHLVSIQGV